MTERNPPAAEPVPVSGKAGIANAAWFLLSDLYDAAERGVFATACDSRSERKLAWRLDELGLARWCGTNWGSHFFAITDAGKALIDREVSELRARLDAKATGAA